MVSRFSYPDDFISGASVAKEQRSAHSSSDSAALAMMPFQQEEEPNNIAFEDSSDDLVTEAMQGPHTPNPMPVTDAVTEPMTGTETSDGLGATPK